MMTSTGFFVLAVGLVSAVAALVAFACIVNRQTWKSRAGAAFSFALNATFALWAWWLLFGRTR